MSLYWNDPRIATLFKIVENAPRGATACEIAAGLDPVVPHRTVQRMLRGLVISGFLRTQGAGPKTRYLPPSWYSVVIAFSQGLQGVPPGGSRPTAVATPSAVAAGVKPIGRNPVPAPQPAARVLPPNPPPQLVAPRVIAPAVVPPPRPVLSPRQREKFKEQLDQVIPIIVQQLMKRRDGLAYAQLAADALWNDGDEFMRVITAELDALDATSGAVYGLDPATVQKWRRRWDSQRAG